MDIKQLGLTLAVAFTLATYAQAVVYDDNWHTGRATHYGGPGDAWTIHDGWCGWGWLSPNVGTGWDVAAISDKNYDFEDKTSSDGGSCGVCYEIACQGMTFTDFYGQTLKRDSVCHDSSTSVVVMISDLCPCNYPTNAYSNKRWCCGDMQHLDISVYTFEKLADVKYGVIGIKYRRVPCNHQPSKRAGLPSWGQAVSKDAHSWVKPSDFTDHKDKRWPVIKGEGIYASASASAWSSSSSASSSSSSSVSVSYGSAASSASSSASASNTLTNMYFGGVMSGWTQSAWSFNWWGRDSSWGLDGQQAMCGTMEGYGGINLQGWTGAFSGKRFIEMWMKKNGGALPDVSAITTSGKGDCRTVNLKGIQVSDTRSDWAKVVISLTSFDWRGQGGGSNAFGGCSSTISDWDVNTLRIQNNWGGQQYLCMDQVKLY